MAEIQAFPAMRFTAQAGDIDRLVCPPYDIVSEEERARYLKTNPHNIIRLELPREGADPYAQAGDTLRRWLNDGILACDPAPYYYIYEEEFEVEGTCKTIKGLVCRVRLEEFSSGIILPHEETLSKAKEDRFNLMKATGCNFSSIYSLYFDRNHEAAAVLERLSAGDPLLSFKTEDGITHRVWRRNEPDHVAAMAQPFHDKTLYIADGHHRYETALRYRNHLRDQGLLTEDHPANYIMMTLVAMEHPGLVVFPTHRIVHSLGTYDPAALRAGCEKYFTAQPCTPENMEQLLREKGEAGEKSVVLYDQQGPLLLTLKNPAVMQQLLPNASGASRMLDVNILHLLILEQLLGIDRENLANQKNLTYTRDAAQAVGSVDAGNADCAFLINATRVEEIAAVASAGEKMPQKSTYFYPKLITGHLMNQILQI